MNYQQLFDLMSNEHMLTLTESEMREIVIAIETKSNSSTMEFNLNISINKSRTPIKVVEFEVKTETGSVKEVISDSGGLIHQQYIDCLKQLIAGAEDENGKEILKQHG